MGLLSPQVVILAHQMLPIRMELLLWAQPLNKILVCLEEILMDIALVVMRAMLPQLNRLILLILLVQENWLTLTLLIPRLVVPMLPKLKRLSLMLVKMLQVQSTKFYYKDNFLP